MAKIIILYALYILKYIYRTRDFKYKDLTHFEITISKANILWTYFIDKSNRTTHFNSSFYDCKWQHGNHSNRSSTSTNDHRLNGTLGVPKFTLQVMDGGKVDSNSWHASWDGLLKEYTKHTKIKTSKFIVSNYNFIKLFNTISKCAILNKELI
jgi:hypothetical protein